MIVSAAIREAWAVLFPVECAGCGAADQALCGSCATGLLPDVTARLGPDGLRVHTAVRYEGAVRRVILQFKEHGRTDATATLARSLAAAVDAAVDAAVPATSGGVAASAIPRGAVSGGATVELLAVPSSRAAYRRRGYDPVRRLLGSAGLKHTAVLVQVQRRAVQKSLGVADRAVNRFGAFVARRHLHGRRFILVDDVLTSGATLREASRAVRAAGGEVIGAATLAFTPRVLPIRDKSVGEDYGGAKGA